jgi:oligoribonuclease
MTLQAPPALLWLDLETTGLNHDEGRILEVAAVLDAPASFVSEVMIEFRESSRFMLGRHPRAQTTIVDKVIMQDEPVDALPWEPVAREMHQKSGLYDALVTTKPDADDALAVGGCTRLRNVEEALLEILGAFPAKSVMLAGSSVHFDRAWLRVHMPKVDAILSHRHMDASCVGLFIGMVSDPSPASKRIAAHRACEDVWNSIRSFYAAADVAWGWKQGSADMDAVRSLFTGHGPWPRSTEIPR